MSHVIDWSLKSLYHFQKLLGNMKQTMDKKKAVTVNILCIDDIFVVLYTYEELIMNVLISSWWINYYPRMRVGNVFGHVCLSVCLSVCVSVCSGYNFWTALHRNFILGQVWVSRSLGQGQGHMRKKIVLLISTSYSFVCGYRSLIRSRSHIKVQVTSRSK